MGRRIQKGLNYTFLPVDFFDDIKIQRLYMKTKQAAAPLVYQAFLCLIYREGYYIRWDDDMLFIVAQKVHMEEDEVSRILAVCLELDLFDEQLFKNENVLTSHGIQNYYDETCRKSRLSDRVTEYSLLENAGSTAEMPINVTEKAISANSLTEKSISAAEMPINARNDCKNVPNRIEENRKERNYFYSSLSSLPSDEEKQQQEIVFEFFMRNWAAPRKEFFDKFLPYNNTGKRRWASMDAASRKAAVKLWKQEPQQKPRFSDKFLTFWYHLFRYVSETSTYKDIVWDMLDDGLICIEDNNRLTLITTKGLMDYLESCGDHFHDIAKEYLGARTKLYYKIINNDK